MIRTTVLVYQNDQDQNRYVEVHNDGYRHYSVKEYVRLQNGAQDYLGDGKLHRRRKYQLEMLLSGYSILQHTT